MPLLEHCIQHDATFAAAAGESLLRFGADGVPSFLALLGNDDPGAHLAAEAALWHLAARSWQIGAVLRDTAAGAADPLRARLERVLDLAGASGLRPAGRP